MKEPAFNPITLRKAKIVYNFGLFECNRVNSQIVLFVFILNVLIFRYFFFTKYLFLELPVECISKVLVFCGQH